jgi:multidrug efflux system membrane fusion protein
MKKLLVFVVLMLISAGLCWRVYTVQQAKAAAAAGGKRGGDAPVRVALAERRSMPVEIRTFGAVQPRASVTVKTQVGGLLAEVCFTEGQDVCAGDLLARIDPRPFEVALRRAEAALASARAERANAERALRRQSELFAKGFTSETDRDQAATTLAVRQAEERAEEAAIDNARIQLGYCTIRAPMAGRTGRRLADPGNLAAENATALVTINEVRPVHVAFSVPQQELERVRGAGALTNLEVEVALPGAAAAAERGRLVFVDNAVDRATGTVLLKAEFANGAGALWPGRFVDVRMCVAVEANAVVVPFKAVQNGQKGTYVFVVKPDGTVEARPVAVARSVDELSVIASGLSGGEQVVAEGQQRLADGVRVQVAGGGAPERAAP